MERSQIQRKNLVPFGIIMGYALMAFEIFFSPLFWNLCLPTCKFRKWNPASLETIIPFFPHAWNKATTFSWRRNGWRQNNCWHFSLLKLQEHCDNILSFVMAGRKLPSKRGCSPPPGKLARLDHAKVKIGRWDHTGHSKPQAWLVLFLQKAFSSYLAERGEKNKTSVSSWSLICFFFTNKQIPVFLYTKP